MRTALLPFVLLLACAHAPPVAPIEPPAPAPAPAPTVIEPDTLTLERTACAGQCPVYTLTILRDGHVHFVGRADVAVEGERDWKIEKAFSAHLFSEFERAGFLTLGARYPTEVEEFPGVVLTLRRAGVLHRVQLGGEGSAELPRDLDAEHLISRLATLVDKLTASGRFTEKDSKKKAGGCVE